MLKKNLFKFKKKKKEKEIIPKNCVSDMYKVRLEKYEIVPCP